MVDNKLHGWRSLSPLFTWLLSTGLCAASFLWFRSFFPPPSNDIFIASFLALSALLAVSFFGIGHFMCTRIFRVTGSMMEIPVGVGALAMFLTFYLRISLNPLLPLSLLFVGCLNSVRISLASRVTLATELSRHSTAMFAALCGVILVSLSFPTIGDGFLLFPNDFDSNLIHVTGPRIIVEHGYFFNPDWLRGLWLPQLTMTLYTFILTFANQLFLKTLNVVCFIQLGLLFGRTAPTSAGRMVALACFALLTALPEFRQYIVQTNLDTIFALFTVSSFFLFLNYLTNPTLNSLILLGFICGLSAGQKHFGLMYSAPIMVIASLSYMANGRSIREAVKRSPVVAAAGTILIATFCCFYLHNLLSGNALLFPFIGTKVNNYGWDESDLTQMIQSTIPHWGHSKTLGGFFLLPLHLIQYPQKYQFQTFGTWKDLGMSVTIASVYAITVASFMLKPLRRPHVILPCLVLCADIFLWYKGSQVIRYLFPVLIASALTGSWLLQLSITRFNNTAALQRILTCLGIVCAATLSALLITPPQTPLAQNDEEARGWLTTYRGSKLDALRWLSLNVPLEKGILNLAGHAEMAQFPRLRLCGDWFGRYRYSRFLTGYIQFRPWSELKDALTTNQLSYIVVNWNTFAPHSKLPTNPAEWAVAIPESTQNCLEHVYNDGVSTDVYKVKEACLL